MELCGGKDFGGGFLKFNIMPLSGSSMFPPWYVKCLNCWKQDIHNHVVTLLV